MTRQARWESLVDYLVEYFLVFRTGENDVSSPVCPLENGRIKIPLGIIGTSFIDRIYQISKLMQDFFTELATPEGTRGSRKSHENVPRRDLERRNSRMMRVGT